MKNIEPWCISRQIWWGHRIPAWYDEEKNIYVGKSEEDVRKKYDIKKTHNYIVNIISDIIFWLYN